MHVGAAALPKDPGTASGATGSPGTQADRGLPGAAGGGPGAGVRVTPVTAGPTTAPATASPSTAPPTTAAPSPTLTTAAPTTTRATTPAPTPTGTTAAAYEDQVLALVNTQRGAAGCAPLTADPALRDLARAHSDDMADRDYFAHDTPDGKTPWNRAAAVGIDYLGAENIARGQATPAAVMDAWMNSPGHRANILDCGLHKLGVGVRTGTGGPWWTQDFGR
ncbi:CAP domain-containing protein [Yinghuangia seranimata]|uniref:CAP domain-containing protein n=1 Tax=Yinghuangia seranimata TaxID=408067 RepID=UPI00248BA042|nr:CAP domain-containing protein [Yinghuangia seranimata]MDI2129296.1 CAP domain-containing protein [Yinghuangia seranimata]